jgi:hypothetical protein
MDNKMRVIKNQIIKILLFWDAAQISVKIITNMVIRGSIAAKPRKIPPISFQLLRIDRKTRARNRDAQIANPPSSQGMYTWKLMIVSRLNNKNTYQDGFHAVNLMLIRIMAIIAHNGQLTKSVSDSFVIDYAIGRTTSPEKGEMCTVFDCLVYLRVFLT